MPRRNAKSWSSLLRDPFHRDPCHIPDDATMDSGVVTSRQLYQLTPFLITGTANNHNGGFVLMPHPVFFLYSLYETSAGSLTLSDLNAAGTSYNGTQGAVSNAAGIMPSGLSGRVRMTAMGIRVTYEGTELNRAGRFFAGLCPVQFAASGVASTGTALSALSTICGSSSSTIASMKQCMTNMVSARVADGTFEAHWFPNGVPTYQSWASASTGWLPLTTTAGAAVTPSALNAPPGLGGVQGGQNALVFFVENDYVASAAAFGNTYTVELVVHWEVIPSSPWSVPYSLSPSQFSSQQLQAALNSTRIQLGMVHDAPVMSVGRSAGKGNTEIVGQRKPGTLSRLSGFADSAGRAALAAIERIDQNKLLGELLRAGVNRAATAAATSAASRMITGQSRSTQNRRRIRN